MTDATTDTPTVYKLATPIETGRGHVSELTIRPPTGRNFLAGVPFKTREIVYDDGSIGYETEFNPKICFAFLADMTGLDEITIESISAADVYPLFKVVMNACLGRPLLSSI